MSKFLIALCSSVLQGCRKNISKHRGSNCSCRSASKIAAQPVLASIVIKLITSTIVHPTALTSPMGMETVPVCAREASIKLLRRGKWELTSSINEAFRPSNHVAASGLLFAWGDRGGEGEDRSCGAASRPSSSTPMLTTSSSPKGIGGGDNGERVGVQRFAPSSLPTEVWKMTFDKMELAADTPPGDPEKMREISRFTALSAVSCLKRSSPKQSESFCDRSSKMIKVTFSCVSDKLLATSSCSRRRPTKPSVAKTSCDDCSAQRKRVKSSASDLK
mmetsp:Transcript_123678/g.309078  ORF Transcript_123678/g.309078 Transcript_123678/m.309078 type:complete len:275 (+) Transcript_123678:582-1406(+)